MITFDTFTPADGVPIYLQIIRHIKQGIVAGTVCDGDEMPSRRVLSALLGVNPNTVQKAYRQLEEEGLISSHTGAKSYIVLTGERIAAVRAEQLSGVLGELLAAVRAMGVDREEALGLLAQLWDKEG